jgi:hypothetical protein
MTGPEHYQHAEMLLDLASNEDFDTEAERSRHVAAQVHATLALAAATALVDYHSNGMTEGDQTAWYRAASEQPEYARRRREERAAEAAEFEAAGPDAGAA